MIVDSVDSSEEGHAANTGDACDNIIEQAMNFISNNEYNIEEVSIRQLCKKWSVILTTLLLDE